MASSRRREGVLRFFSVTAVAARLSAAAWRRRTSAYFYRHFLRRVETLAGPGGGQSWRNAVAEIAAVMAQASGRRQRDAGPRHGVVWRHCASSNSSDRISGRRAGASCGIEESKRAGTGVYACGFVRNDVPKVAIASSGDQRVGDIGSSSRLLIVGMHRHRAGTPAFVVGGHVAWLVVLVRMRRRSTSRRARK